MSTSVDAGRLPLGVRIGYGSGSVATGAFGTVPGLMLLPFLGSGFVPTDDMPTGLRWFAEHQPFTPVMDALRALLDGSSSGSDLAVALAWCAGLTLAGWALSVRTYGAERAA